MSPDEIDAVARTWARAMRRPVELEAAVAARLPEGGHHPASARAAWIVDAVSRLTEVIDRPTSFGPAAAAVIAQRGAVTTAELAADRDALLGALREVLGPLHPVGEAAWELAFGLFHEIVLTVCLDPFGASAGGVTTGAEGGAG